MSSNPDEPWLIALGAVVSDGGHVDWTDAERRETTAEQRQLIDRLREVAAVVEAHRTAGASEAATDRDSPAPPPLPWRHLVLFERVGTGAFGSVHRAWDSLLDREVAVKLLPKSRPGAAAPLDEARYLARVRHSNVVVVHGADEDEHGAGIWMEYIEGETLATIVHERGPMGGREVAGIGLDLCGALSAIHAAGLLHRDIKAHNVMREVGGRIVLMDFSGAHAQSAGGAGVPLSGTPLYMAPELFDGVGATPASDVYSLGVLLFFLLTGILPVAGETLEDVRKAHAQGQRKRLRDIRPDVADGLVQVVERAIEANPDLRFRTAGELERALAAASGAHVVVVSPTVPGTEATHQAPAQASDVDLGCGHRRRCVAGRSVRAMAGITCVAVATGPVHDRSAIRRGQLAAHLSRRSSRCLRRNRRRQEPFLAAAARSDRRPRADGHHGERNALLVAGQPHAVLFCGRQTPRDRHRRRVITRPRGRAVPAWR